MWHEKWFEHGINTGLAVRDEPGSPYRQVMLIDVSGEGSVQVWNPDAGADPVQLFTLRPNNRLIHHESKDDAGYPRLVIRADIRAEYPQLWKALVEP
jgi:hypothetical protein